MMQMTMKKSNTSWLNILLLVIPYLISISVFLLIGYAITGVDYLHVDVDVILTTQQEFFFSLFNCLGTITVLWFFMKYADKEPFAEMGFHIKSRRVELFLGVLLGFVIMSFFYFLLIQLNEIRHLSTVVNTVDLCYFFLTCTFVSFSEEMLLRGYVLRNLMYSFNKYAALLISAILFSLMHGANPSMDGFSYLSLFSAGVLLGATYIYTRNLWFPIAFHFSWNFFQSIFGFNVSGQDFYSIFNFEINQNNRINGGDFGFEGSYFSLISELALIIMIFYYYEKKKKQL